MALPWIKRWRLGKILKKTTAQLKTYTELQYHLACALSLSSKHFQDKPWGSTIRSVLAATKEPANHIRIRKKTIEGLLNVKPQSE